MKDKQYNQRLTPIKAAEGIKVIMENSLSLLSDAILLFENNRFERAFTLSILSIEESGKIPILRSILLEDNQKELNKLWKNFRTHTEKNWALFFLKIPVDESTKLEDFKALFDNTNNQGQEFENLKQLSIYTELFKNSNWHSPKNLISEKLAKNTLNTTKLFVNDNLSAMTTEPELELWIKHLKPVWKSDMNLMKDALKNCYKEAEQLGVLTGLRTVDELIKFI
jgi:AbiV family abortive infection protein